MEKHECSRQQIHLAVKFCQSLTVAMTSVEEIHALIDAKSNRISELYERLARMEAGWREATVILTEGRNGTRTTKRTTHKFAPSAEVLIYREIRELEDDITELKGLDTYVRSRTTTSIDADDITDELLSNIESYLEEESHD